MGRLMDNRIWGRVDWFFVLIVLFLLSASIFILSTASLNVDEDDPYHYVRSQLIWIGTGLVLMVFAAAIDYRHWQKIVWVMYGFNILLLLMVFFLGSSAKGATRWIYITSTQGLQPSEFAKIFLILTFAHFLAKREDKLRRARDFILPLIFVLPPALLVFKQPDLGTSLVFAAIFIGMMFVAGAHPWKFGGILLGGFAVVVLAVFFNLATDLPKPFDRLEGLPLPLEDYQLKRLTSFIDPESDLSDDSYHVVQSIWAIGSGGLWGKGYRDGTQGQYNFLPEHHTDFIFSIVGEEFGFIGASALLLAFCLLLLRMIHIASGAADLYGMLVVSGIISMLLFQIFENVGMVSGIMPITGIPLPFITSGGSSMWTNMIGAGLVLNVAMRRERPMFDTE
ncbi:MAG: rod shape-determining protein RodA [Gracilibacteraceae bacterium]|jgi:rod shape determining protein RodA|nr:rod shape-determining protein RodA [Gracilibacteraceae bacterium]